MRLKVPIRSAAAVAVVLAAVGVTGRPALAAYPESSFYVSYGNSVLQGTMTWYNLSAKVAGTIKSGGDCRSAWVIVSNNSGTDDWFSPQACNGGSISISHTFDQTGAGGWTSASVYLRDENGTIRGTDRCFRTEPYCQTA
jgi:hypothetical protein